MQQRCAKLTSQAKDNFYAQVHLTSTASVILSTNAGSQTFQGQPGINRFQFPLSAGSGIKVQVVRFHGSRRIAYW